MYLFPENIRDLILLVKKLTGFFFMLTYFKLVNSTVYHKSSLGYFISLCSRDHHILNHRSIVSNSEKSIQRRYRYVYIYIYVLLHRVSVCSVLRAKSLFTKAEFWRFPPMFYFVNPSSRIQKFVSLNNPKLM